MPGLNIRGDNFYCPLAFGLDTYWKCSFDCTYCYCREMNQIWGNELRPLDSDKLRKQLESGLKNKSPKTSLAWAIKNKKTIRLGNKSDPFPPEEPEEKATLEALKILSDLDWSIKIETKSLLYWTDEYRKYLSPRRVSITTSATVGVNDYRLFEGGLDGKMKGTIKRITTLEEAQREGYNVAVITEPFLPGYHTPKEFETFVNWCGHFGIRNFNVYNAHLSPFVVKRMAKVIGIDAVEKIVLMNEDKNWRPILKEIIAIAKEKNIVLGCPDFVNSGKYSPDVNTCCGVNVHNPCTMNFNNWKAILLKEGLFTMSHLESTNDGVGDWKEAEKLFNGEKSEDFYGFSDIGFCIRRRNGWSLIDREITEPEENRGRKKPKGFFK